jgi:glucose/arabinose dehydrogenase
MTDADLSADVEIVAEGLEIPWEVAWLPDGSMLVTERPGRLSKIATSRQVIPIAGVEHVGEGGLLGLAVHPHFTQNHWIYLYLTTQSEGGLINRVERYQLVNSQLSDRKVVLDGIPGASFHDGGRLAFGPDGLLYITTGDAGQESNAQDPQSLAGKILRVGDDGSIPTGNPFANPVYSWGHRNPQGLAWDRAGRLWATEHGRSGIQSGLDEINMIMRGHNYGWPIIQGDEQQADMDKPVVHSGPRETWAPAGAAIWGDSLFFAGLRGESLYEAKLQDGRVEGVVAHFYQQFGRLRVVALGPDNYLYLATSNRDGRGSVQTGDDKIFRIKPASLPAGSLN